MKAFPNEQDIDVHAPVQDALLVAGVADEIGDVVAATVGAMAQPCDLLLYGFGLCGKRVIVRLPDRYSDERGVAMWNRVMRLFAEIEGKSLDGNGLHAGTESRRSASGTGPGSDRTSSSSVKCPESAISSG
jgi:hypothetical protein